MKTSATSPEAAPNEAARTIALSALRYAIDLAKLWAGEDEVALAMRRALREMKHDRPALPLGGIH